MPKREQARRGGARAKTKAKQSQVRPRWTNDEVAILRRMYRTHSNAEIARVLGRKVSSVVFKGHRLGLSKGIRRLKEMGRENIRRRWTGTATKSSRAAAAPRVPKPAARARRAQRSR